MSTKDQAHPMIASSGDAVGAPRVGGLGGGLGSVVFRALITAAAILMIGGGAIGQNEPAEPEASGNSAPLGRIAERLGTLEGKMTRETMPQEGPSRRTPSGAHQDKSDRELIIELLNRVESLETRADSSDQFDEEVDLLEENLTFLQETQAQSVMARHWSQNFHMYGFMAFGFFATGSAGDYDHPAFVMKAATLFIEADVWEDVQFFVEIEMPFLGLDSFLELRTGEMYAHFRNVLPDGVLHIKVGRIDIPFGEEYVWQDAPDDPLISNTAPYFYIYDEGILLYGEIADVGWVFSVMNSNSRKSISDTDDKSFNLKVYGDPWPWLYVSGSLMRTGATSSTALKPGGLRITPVGAGGRPSTAGVSPSDGADTWLYEIDFKVDFGEGWYVMGFFGQAFLDDADSSFNREWLWFMIEVLYNITPEIFVVGRYSEVGTYDNSEGYINNGRIFNGVGRTLGFDQKRFQRFSLGFGYRLNPKTLLKIEGGWDRFTLIDASPIDPENGNRWYTGVEVVVSF